MDTEEKKQAKREYMRRYNATEKGAEYNRAHVARWRRNNPDKSIRSQYRNRSRMTDYRDIVRNFLVERDGMICKVCNLTIENITDGRAEIDHIIPVRLGGDNSTSNIRLVHAHCNQKNAIETRTLIHGH